jgi:hypothetical protein
MKSFKPEELIGKVLRCSANECYIILPPINGDPEYQIALQRIQGEANVEPHFQHRDVFPYEVRYINQRVNDGSFYTWTILDAPAPVNKENYEIF